MYLYDIICRNFDLYETGADTAVFLICVALCIIVPYLIGSINPSIIISRKKYNEDIRSYGSGNAGTTNTLRTYGKKMAALILVLDMLKAALAVFFGIFLLTRGIGGAIAAIFVVLGHMFPIYYKFKGGKGVACTAICILILSPVTFPIILAVFIVIAVLTRYVSLASIICAMLFPFLNHVFYVEQIDDKTVHTNPGITLAALLIGALVVFMHRDNMKRLMEGKESKFSFKKTDKHKVVDVSAEATSEQKIDLRKEKQYSDDDFVKCACGRIIPRSRAVCVYCGEKNPAYVPREDDKKGRKKRSK
ncbi:MAG: glycerol-3-phosphate 1-O-acyltransferase PlsY [Clostridia bacterium]|nr:glycerol-3-phosphate 1-O-acyltransferase PlsY [Clostridia bacterium]